MALPPNLSEIDELEHPRDYRGPEAAVETAGCTGSGVIRVLFVNNHAEFYFACHVINNDDI